ncbi:hypothetical protein ACS0TY_027868 [Phlomoides rotata]
MGDHFKACAYAPNRVIFEEKLAIFKEVGGSIAEEWLEQLPYDKWALAYSSHITRYGEMTSNAAESFNFWIREARSLPITFMIDVIRSKIVGWYVERRKKSILWSGVLCPSKEDIWNELTDIGRSWFVVECPNGQFEVTSNPSVVVDLRLRVCTCYQWQIRGFPCAHVVAVIRKNCTSIYNHVDEAFFVAKYQQCYMFDINPIPETEKFECQSLVDQPKILPPILKRSAGRPKKSRNLSYGEFPKKKRKFCKRCCKMAPHDNVTCALACDDNSQSSSS